MAEIRCVICNRVNDSEEQRCWYCQAFLHKHQVAQPPKTGETKDGSAEVPVAPGARVEHPAAASQPEEVIPEWLERIRALKRREMGIAEESTPPFIEAEVTPTETASESSPPTESKVVNLEPASSEEAQISPEIPESPMEEEFQRVEETPAESAVREEPAQDQAFLVDDLPDWLAEVDTLPDQPPETEAVVEEAKPVEGAALEAGFLPAWLQAIKPVEIHGKGRRHESGSVDRPSTREAITGGDNSSPVDGQGSEEHTPAIPGELRISASQARNAELFSRLLAPTSTPVAASAAATKKTGGSRLVRGLVMALLFLSALVPLFDRDGSGVQPVLFAPEVVDAYLVMRAVPGTKPALVISQFEPGLAGEMRMVMRPIFEDLLERGVPLVAASTTATGYAVLEQEVAEISATAPATSFVNLGYLPGGSIGMLSLIADPRQSLPLTTDLKPAWESEMMSAVTRLDDFGVLLLVTDNAEISRTWIEQVASTKAALPVIVLSSAQIAPLVQPYYASGQVDGYIAGISGSLAYSKISQKPAAVAQLYGSYQLTLLLAAAVILIGGIVNLILGAGPASKPGVKS